jgi:hypothetical protein
LCAAEFVACAKHWDAVAEQQGGHHVPHLAVAESGDPGLVRWSLDPAIPGTIVVGAVPIFLAVRLIVLDVVGNQVAHGESVVCVDVVNAGARLAIVVCEEVSGAGQPGGQFVDTINLVTPVVP